MKSKRKFLIIFGTRPEAIKLIPLIHQLKKYEDVTLSVCVSAQHRQMLDSVLSEYRVIPDYDLDLMQEEQTLGQLSSRLLENIDKVLADECPDTVIVHGDTTTAICGALTAFYKKIPIIHIEAGLRSNNINSPFPEEFNRRTISTIASIHFAPTDSAKKNLLLEGISEDKIFVVGNTAIDMLSNEYDQERPRQLPFELPSDKFALLTLHRREHDDAKLCEILSAIEEISKNITIIFPMHKNPRIRNIVREKLSSKSNVILCEPLKTRAFRFLLKNCFMVMTDSGGIQEEATFLGKPTLVLRDTTERPEGILAGTLILAGTSKEKIEIEARNLLEDSEFYHHHSVKSLIFGDGHAAERIANILCKIF